MFPIDKILVPVDFSEHSAKALEVAIGFAKALDAEVHLLHCYQISPAGVSSYGIVLPESYYVELRSGASARLDSWVEKAVAAGVQTQPHLVSLAPSLGIAETADAIQPDLIVIGTRGLAGIKHILLGSVAERTVRTAACPVLTVKVSDPE